MQLRTAINMHQSPEEQWRPIHGVEDRYEVSDRGQVRSLGWQTATRGYVRGRPLKPVLMGGKILGVHLHIGAGRIPITLRRLVAMHFVSPAPHIGARVASTAEHVRDCTAARLYWMPCTATTARFSDIEAAHEARCIGHSINLGVPVETVRAILGGPPIESEPVQIDNPATTWRDVPGTAGKYQVSAAGIVRLLDGVPGRRRFGRPCVWRDVVQEVGPNCRNHLPMYDGAASLTVWVDEVVMRTFGAPPPFFGACIEHVDGNMANSAISNLRWTRGTAASMHAAYTATLCSLITGGPVKKPSPRERQRACTDFDFHLQGVGQ